MMNRHCTEDELQLFAVEQTVQGTDMTEHIENCSLCQEQIAVYRLLFSEISNQPKTSFDFDLAGSVLKQLQPVKTITVIKKNNYALLPATFAAIFVITSLYIFRKNFLNLSTGISSLFLVISGIACLSIIIYKVVKLYHKYELQIKKLNLSE